MIMDKVDGSICPLCQQSNCCDVQTQQACWCMQVEMPDEFLNKLPVSLKNTACICKACLADFHQQLAVSIENNHESID